MRRIDAIREILVQRHRDLIGLDPDEYDLCQIVLDVSDALYLLNVADAALNVAQSYSDPEHVDEARYHRHLRGLLTVRAEHTPENPS